MQRLPLALYASDSDERGNGGPGSLAAGARGSTQIWVWALVVGVTLALPWFLLGHPGDIHPEARQIGGVLWVLALLPTVAYFATPQRCRPPIPMLPMIGIFFALYFPMQLLLGAANANDLVSLDPSTDYHLPAQLTLIGWGALLVGYGAFSLRVRTARPRPDGRWTVATLKRWAFTMQIGGLVFEIAKIELSFPIVVHGLFFFASMLALLGTAILVVLGQRGQLTSREKSLLCAAAAVMALVQIGTGSVATFARSGVTLLLATWIGAPRLRASIVMVGLVLSAIILTLRGFVIDYRNRAWWAGEDLSQSHRAELWYRLISDQVNQRGVLGTVGQSTYVVATRSATLDLYADVIRQTPRTIPYWGGQTYLSLIGAFVPRFLWPGKPYKRLGNDFGHRYGYLEPRDRNTSINLPYPIELYVNFGEWGVVIGMLVIGGILAALGRLFNRASQDWVWSLCGVVLLVPVITNLESDFSLVFGGLVMNGVALAVVYRFLQLRCRPGLHPASDRDPFAISALTFPGVTIVRDSEGPDQIDRWPWVFLQAPAASSDHSRLEPVLLPSRRPLLHEAHQD